MLCAIVVISILLSILSFLYYVSICFYNICFYTMLSFLYYVSILCLLVDKIYTLQCTFLVHEMQVRSIRACEACGIIPLLYCVMILRCALSAQGQLHEAVGRRGAPDGGASGRWLPVDMTSHIASYDIAGHNTMYDAGACHVEGQGKNAQQV